VLHNERNSLFIHIAGSALFWIKKISVGLHDLQEFVPFLFPQVTGGLITEIIEKEKSVEPAALN